MPDPATDTPTSDTALGGILNPDIGNAIKQGLADQDIVRKKALALPQKLKDLDVAGEAKEKPVQEKLDALTADEMRIYQGKPPQTEPTSVMEQWGSPAMLFAIFGSMMTRQPMMSALNAAAAVGKAFQTRDSEAADKAYKQWKDSNDTALKIFQLQSNMLEKAIDKIRNGTKDEKAEAEADLRATTSALGLTHVRDLIDAGKQEEAIGMINTIQDAAAKVQGFRDKSDYIFDLQKRTQEIGDKVKAARTAKDPTALADAQKEAAGIQQEWQRWRDISSGKKETTGKSSEASKNIEVTDSAGKSIFSGAAHKDANGKWIRDDNEQPIPEGNIRIGASQPLPTELKVPDEWEGMPNKPPPGVREDVWDTTLYFARTHQMPALGFQPGMRNLVIQAYPAALKALGIPAASAADVSAAYAGQRHADIVAGGRMAQISLGINEAKQAAPQVIATSLQVPRFQFPAANQFSNWLAEKTGDPNIVAFKEALNTYLNIYASVVSRTGRLTDSQQNHAYDLLSTAYNQGQIERGIQQLNYEMDLMKEAVPETMREMPGSFQPPGIAPAHQAPTPPGSAPSTTGTPPPAPPVGTVEDGHRFKGGDPADPKNWEAVQ